MILVNKAFMTVWDVEVLDKYCKANCSTSEKDNRNEGQYINSSWFGVRFVGKAFEKAQSLKKGDKIDISSMKLSNTKGSKEDENGKFRYFLNVVVFDFEVTGNVGGGKTDKKDEKIESDDSDSELPF